jgi:hypothetical protein
VFHPELCLKNRISTEPLIHIPLYAILLFSYAVIIVLLQQSAQNDSETIYNLVSVGLIALIAWGV